MAPKKETSPSSTHTTISPMLTTPDTSISFPVDSSDMIPQVDLDSALPDSDTSFSSDLAIGSLLLSIPPEILPKAIRILTTWRLQEPRSALPTTTVLAEALDCTQPGRRIKWISKEYYEELERERGSRITEKANDDEKDTLPGTETLPGQHDHSSQLRRAFHIPRARLSNSIPTIKPIPTKAIPTTTISSTSISTTKPKSRPRITKSKLRRAIVDSENIPPSQAPTQPRRRPAAGKSRIPAPAPRVFGMHNA
ncbi:hypothetical protein EV421DRAFT_1902222 [Armillaria borealis]|uniref:Uncharacterized protein n=1 Tax=Armillaria borealis TaxID=47425 RepID=A0AA39JNM2_9AGAR|nr:hypothetical protein EV421DRAFT_1902222 [Armillaria borealis]